ncbi:MAG TPA: glycine cleavage system protein GcvH [Rhodobacteraceae bacterium]|nr:glycine cleavage system protein GcvH [Paracoccaceae bacterium]
MSKTRFSKDHEYILVDGDTGTIGISDYAQQQLGDVVFVELPETGASFAKGDEVAVVESVKAASEIYSPVAGTVTEVNAALEDNPATVNEDAMGAGWFVKLKIANSDDLNDLMSEDDYKAYIAGLD